MASSRPNPCRSADVGPRTSGGEPGHAPLVAAAAAAILGREDRHWFSPATPLVVVSKDARPPLVGDLLNACSALGPEAVMICDGPALGAEFAACDDVERMARLRDRLLMRRLVIVCQFDQIGSGRVQMAAARFLDAAAAGTFVCVSLAEPPNASRLAEPLASRLAAGLVVVSTSPADDLGAGEPSWSVGRIIRGTARHHGMSPTLLTGDGRQRSVVAARSLAMYLARRLTRQSLEAIGEAFGGREHTTVLRGVRGVASRVATDTAFSNDVERLVATMRSGPKPGRSSPSSRRRA
ncbi:MAG: helix-turn-helix domain-containing protein [Pirellulales bacterium]